MKRFIQFWPVFSAVALLAGCTVGPHYKRPAVNVPEAYRGAAAPSVPASDPTPLGAQKWSEVFRDPVLQSLLTEALKNNYDVRIAADRVLEQQAQVGITRANQLPTASVGGSYNALGLPSRLLSGNSNHSGSQSRQTNFFAGGFSGSAAWSLDFWGLYRRQTEAARAQLLATEWGQQATYSTLVENVARAYYQLRTLDAQLELTNQTLASRQESLRLTQLLEKGGAGSLADVRQAEQLYYTAQAAIPDLERQIAQQENNLSLLLGRNPGPIPRGQVITAVEHPPALPVGLPSELLERRPDIRQEEARLVAANAQIGVARAQFFPQFSLTGTGGISSSQLKGLAETGNVFYLASGGVTQPIFQGGRLRNNLRLAEAQEKELVATYQQTIAAALRDVANALAAYDKTRAFREQQEHNAAAATDAVRLARLRYNAGSTSYLEVLTNETNRYNAQLTLAAAQLQEALSLVQLYNALGGGW